MGLIRRLQNKVVNYRVDVSFSKGLIKRFYPDDIFLIWHGGGSLSLERRLYEKGGEAQFLKGHVALHEEMKCQPIRRIMRDGKRVMTVPASGSGT